MNNNKKLDNLKKISFLIKNSKFDKNEFYDLIKLNKDIEKLLKQKDNKNLNNIIEGIVININEILKNNFTIKLLDKYEKYFNNLEIDNLFHIDDYSFTFDSFEDLINDNNFKKLLYNYTNNNLNDFFNIDLNVYEDEVISDEKKITYSCFENVQDCKNIDIIVELNKSINYFKTHKEKKIKEYYDNYNDGYSVEKYSLLDCENEYEIQLEDLKKNLRNLHFDFGENSKFYIVPYDENIENMFLLAKTYDRNKYDYVNNNYIKIDNNINFKHYVYDNLIKNKDYFDFVENIDDIVSFIYQNCEQINNQIKIPKEDEELFSKKKKTIKKSNSNIQ